MSRLATGTHVLLPAPPAGYLNALVRAQIKNAHATSTMNFRFFDSDGEIWGPASNALAAGSVDGNTTTTPRWVGDSELSITISGTGTPAEIIAEWHQIPKPAGYVCGVVALTTSYQSVPRVVPTSDRVRTLQRLETDEAALNTMAVWNGDSGAVQPSFRLIRDGVTFEWLGTSIPSLLVGSQQLYVVLQPGDQFAVKAVAIVTPGSFIYRHRAYRSYAANSR